jgi:hypothetical protein
LNLNYIRRLKKEAKAIRMPLGGQYAIPFCGFLLLVLGGVMFLEVNNGDLGQALIGG